MLTRVKIEYNVAGVTEKRDSIIIPEADTGTYDVNVSDETTCSNYNQGVSGIER